MTPGSDPREALAAIRAERETLDAENAALDRELAVARAEVGEKRRGLEALSRLELPGASAMLQAGMTFQMFNWGRDLALDFGGILAIAPSLLFFGLGVWRMRGERRLLEELPLPPTRVEEPPP